MYFLPFLHPHWSGLFCQQLNNGCIRPVILNKSQQRTNTEDHIEEKVHKNLVKTVHGHCPHHDSRHIKTNKKYWGRKFHDHEKPK